MGNEYMNSNSMQEQYAELMQSSSNLLKKKKSPKKKGQPGSPLKRHHPSSSVMQLTKSSKRKRVSRQKSFDGMHDSLENAVDHHQQMMHSTINYRSSPKKGSPIRKKKRVAKEATESVSHDYPNAPDQTI
jgi:hypothetical protein